MKITGLIGMLSIALISMAAEQQKATVVVRGNAHAGTTVTASQTGEETNVRFETNDARLGTNSGNTYLSRTDCNNRDAKMVYGLDLKVGIAEKHLLGLTLEGKHDWKQSFGTRTESICDRNGTGLSRVSGTYNHPQDRMNNVLAGVNYSCSLTRTGDSVQTGYRYHWDCTSSGLEQQISEHTGWALYSGNILHQHISQQTHHAWINYLCRIAKGHTLDMGIAYDRRQIEAHTLQEWDQLRHLDAAYRHLTQYGALHARYRLKAGPVTAMLGLEYRATCMQQRWLHDWIPTALIRYQPDSIHSLTGGYRMLLIRPEYRHLDTTVIMDTYTRSFGNNQLVGTHVHNTNLTYRFSLPEVTIATDLRYITANDGLNALWIERANTRIYTWGNEGIRHAVSLTPSLDCRLSTTTRLRWEATVLRDERIAKAINMSNANWGISTRLRLEQQLPYAMQMALYGDYACHNTLDLYSYAGHGGQLGVNWTMAFLPQHNLHLKVDYACRFLPDIHITQGGWIGVLSYPAPCTHQVEIQIGYRF